MLVASEHMEELSDFLKAAGREGEDLEAWLHALVDMQESFSKIFDEMLVQAIASKSDAPSALDLLTIMRSELNHIAYHIDDVSLR
jgi:hypothetical protein